MSGFAGIVHLDGRPIERHALDIVTPALARHGGEVHNAQFLESTGFIHCPPQDPEQHPGTHQPLSFDGSTWIVGDVRLDARKELVCALQRAGLPASLDEPDIRLALHAYMAWGDQCTARITGDFSFAVWDNDEARLLCVRDHMGVKPFYYTQQAKTIFFSNELRALRSLQAVSDQLHEPAIADYLAFGLNFDEGATFFSDIKRLPPGHTLTVSDAAPAKAREYRDLAVCDYITYKDKDQYVHHFRELLGQAVSDRLTTDPVGFELSGGLDSNLILAKAMQQFSRNAFALTTDFSHQDPQDEEAHYARISARFHGIEHECIEAGTAGDFHTFLDTAQPYAWPFAATSKRVADEMNNRAHVMLTGQGSDPFQHASGYQALDHFREWSLFRFAAHYGKRAIRQGSLKELGLKQLRYKDEPRLFMNPLPDWLNRDFLERSGTFERWNMLFERPGRFPPGCRYEYAWDELHMPAWSHLFEDYYHDLFAGIDCRHPFFDIRIIRFFFSIPPSVKKDKWLLRESAKGAMDERVRTRPKSVVQKKMVQEHLATQPAFEPSDWPLEVTRQWLDRTRYLDSLNRYARGQAGDHFSMVSPLSLEKWLANDKML